MVRRRALAELICLARLERGACRPRTFRVSTRTPAPELAEARLAALFAVPVPDEGSELGLVSDFGETVSLAMTCPSPVTLNAYYVRVV